MSGHCPTCGEDGAWCPELRLMERYREVCDQLVASGYGHEKVIAVLRRKAARDRAKRATTT